MSYKTLFPLFFCCISGQSQLEVLFNQETQTCLRGISPEINSPKGQKFKPSFRYFP